MLILEKACGVGFLKYGGCCIFFKGGGGFQVLRCHCHQPHLLLT